VEWAVLLGPAPLWMFDSTVRKASNIALKREKRPMEGGLLSSII
jgi:hypothetical protein